MGMVDVTIPIISASLMARISRGTASSLDLKTKNYADDGDRQLPSKASQPPSHHRQGSRNESDQELQKSFRQQPGAQEKTATAVETSSGAEFNARQSQHQTKISSKRHDIPVVQSTATASSIKQAEPANQSTSRRQTAPLMNNSAELSANPFAKLSATPSAKLGPAAAVTPPSLATRPLNEGLIEPVQKDQFVAQLIHAQKLLQPTNFSYQLTVSDGQQQLKLVSQQTWPIKSLLWVESRLFASGEVELDLIAARPGQSLITAAPTTLATTLATRLGTVLGAVGLPPAFSRVHWHPSSLGSLSNTAAEKSTLTNPDQNEKLLLDPLSTVRPNIADRLIRDLSSTPSKDSESKQATANTESNLKRHSLIAHTLTSSNAAAGGEITNSVNNKSSIWLTEDRAASKSQLIASLTQLSDIIKQQVTTDELKWQTAITNVDNRQTSKQEAVFNQTLAVYAALNNRFSQIPSIGVGQTSQLLAEDFASLLTFQPKQLSSPSQLLSAISESLSITKADRHHHSAMMTAGEVPTDVKSIFNQLWKTNSAFVLDDTATEQKAVATQPDKPNPNLLTNSSQDNASWLAILSKEKLIQQRTLTDQYINKREFNRSRFIDQNIAFLNHPLKQQLAGNTSKLLSNEPLIKSDMINHIASNYLKNETHLFSHHPKILQQHLNNERVIFGYQSAGPNPKHRVETDQYSHEWVKAVTSLNGYGSNTGTSTNDSDRFIQSLFQVIAAFDQEQVRSLNLYEHNIFSWPLILEYNKAFQIVDFEYQTSPSDENSKSEDLQLTLRFNLSHLGAFDMVIKMNLPDLEITTFSEDKETKKQFNQSLRELTERLENIGCNVRQNSINHGRVPCKQPLIVHNSPSS